LMTILRFVKLIFYENIYWD